MLAMFILIPFIGLYGAAVGPLMATCLISLPNNLRALAREEGTSAMSLLAPLAPWTTRLFVLLACLALFLSAVQVNGLVGLITVSGAVAIVYLAIMFPVLRQPPLGTMLGAAVLPWTGRAQALVKRLAGQPVTLRS